MLKCFCDICEKEIRNYSNNYAIEIIHKSPSSQENFYKDVCEDCRNYIQEKINERKNNSRK